MIWNPYASTGCPLGWLSRAGTLLPERHKTPVPKVGLRTPLYWCHPDFPPFSPSLEVRCAVLSGGSPCLFWLPPHFLSQVVLLIKIMHVWSRTRACFSEELTQHLVNSAFNTLHTITYILHTLWLFGSNSNPAPTLEFSPLQGLPHGLPTTGTLQPKELKSHRAPDSVMNLAPFMIERGPCAWPWNNSSAYRKEHSPKRDDLNFPTNTPWVQESLCDGLFLFVSRIPSSQHPTSCADTVGNLFLEELMQTLQLNLSSPALMVSGCAPWGRERT